MKKLILKYSLLLIGFYFLIRIITTVVFFFDPDILTFQLSETQRTSFSDGYMITGLTYLSNLIIASLLFIDMRKQNATSILVLALSVMSGYLGVVFYLILNYKRTENYE